MKKVVLYSLALLSVSGLALGMSGRTPQPQFYGEFKPAEGAWAEYQMVPHGQPPMEVKVAIVGKEANAYWYEMALEGGKRGSVVTKMLLTGDPADQKNLKRLIVKEGNSPAMEIPAQTMSSAGGGRAGGKAIDKGTETIKVPAGSFEARHVQYQDEAGTVDAWMHKDVGPYGLVKSQSKDMEMVLLGYGSGARTQIAETPQRLEIPAVPTVPDLRSKKRESPDRRRP